LPVAAFFFREYKRNCPDLSLRIMPVEMQTAKGLMPAPHESVLFEKVTALEGRLAVHRWVRYRLLVLKE